MAITINQTAELEQWSDVEDSTDWPTLLVGNGASVNLWGDFAYPSLYQRANLSAIAKAVFGDLGVTNFETVLEAIHHVHVVVNSSRCEPVPPASEAASVTTCSGRRPRLSSGL
jgi:hypothetical protein